MPSISKRFLGAAMAITGSLASATALAELSASAALTSNYMFSGVTQTDYRTALPGEVRATHASGSYAAVWGSTVDKGAEIDLILGNSGTIKGVIYNLGLISHEYTDKDFFEGSIRELYIGGRYGPFSFMLSDGITNRPGGQFDQAYYDYGFNHAVFEHYDLKLHYGYLDNEYLQRHIADYSLGVAREVSGMTVAIAYSHNDLDKEGTVYISLTKAYPTLK